MIFISQMEKEHNLHTKNNSNASSKVDGYGFDMVQAWKKKEKRSGSYRTGTGRRK